MSREIDARVAREVMGLVNGDIPYSTDMNAAMEVVEKMRERFEWFQLIRERPGVWESSFSHPGEEHAQSTDADTPAEAICLAALGAVNPGTTQTTHKIDNFGTSLPK